MWVKTALGDDCWLVSLFFPQQQTSTTAADTAFCASRRHWGGRQRSSADIANVQASRSNRILISQRSVTKSIEASANRPASERSESAKKAARTHKRRAAFGRGRGILDLEPLIRTTALRRKALKGWEWTSLEYGPRDGAFANQIRHARESNRL
jgi:hypothetical protein